LTISTINTLCHVNIVSIVPNVPSNIKGNKYSSQKTKTASMKKEKHREREKVKD
jgi:hypothetical protein